MIEASTSPPLPAGEACLGVAVPLSRTCPSPGTSLRYQCHHPRGVCFLSTVEKISIGFVGHPKEIQSSLFLTHKKHAYKGFPYLRAANRKLLGSCRIMTPSANSASYSISAAASPSPGLSELPSAGGRWPGRDAATYTALHRTEDSKIYREPRA